MSDQSDLALCEQGIARFRKRIVTILFVGYLLNCLDRANVSYAHLQMGSDVNLSIGAYGFGAGLFFIGYALFCVPASMMVGRIGIRRWLACVIFAWGIVACSMALIQGTTSFYVLRFLLGVTEAGFIPAVSYFIASWVPPAFRSRVNAIFIIALPVSLIIGGPLSGLLLKLSGPMSGWQWMFLLQGLPTVILGLVVLRRLPDSPKHAKWLPEEERLALMRALDAAGAATPDARAGWSAGFSVFVRRPAIWGVMAILLLAYAATFAMVFFFPTLLKNLYRINPVQVGTLSVIPNAIAIMVTYCYARSAEHFADIRWHLALICLVGAIGFALLGSAADTSMVAFLAVASVITTFTIAYYAPLVTAMQNIVGPHAGPFALVATLTSVGGFFGPTLMGFVMQAHHGDWRPAMWIFSGAALGAALLAALVIRNEPRIPQVMPPDQSIGTETARPLRSHLAK